MTSDTNKALVHLIHISHTALRSHILPCSCGCFRKIGIPQNGWFIMENPIFQWMIWGYHYFRKPPCLFLKPVHVDSILMAIQSASPDLHVLAGHVRPPEMVDFYLECATLVHQTGSVLVWRSFHLKLDVAGVFSTETFPTFQETSNKIEVLVGHSMQLKNDILFEISMIRHCVDALKEINEIHPANRGFQFPRRWTFG